MVGKIKYASGTFASLFACILFSLLLIISNITVILFITVIIFLYSFSAINNFANEFKSDDPEEIVIDEVVGQMLALLAMPIYETLYPLPAVYYYVSAFLLFRLFDIWKPYPIGYVDNNVKGALGIMLDDILAGIYTIIILTVILFFLGG